MPTKSLGSNSLIVFPELIGDLEPCGMAIELERLDLIDHRLLAISGEGIPFAFKASRSSWGEDSPSIGWKSSTRTLTQC